VEIYSSKILWELRYNTTGGMGGNSLLPEMSRKRDTGESMDMGIRQTVRRSVVFLPHRQAGQP